MVTLLHEQPKRDKNPPLNERQRTLVATTFEACMHVRKPWPPGCGGGWSGLTSSYRRHRRGSRSRAVEV
jgi:hypothetical protein